MSGRSFELFRTDPAPGSASLQLSGRLVFAETALLWRELVTLSEPLAEGTTLDVDLSGLLSADGGSMALLVQLRADLHRRGVLSELRNAAAPVQQLVHLYAGDVRVDRLERRRPTGVLDGLGKAALVVVEHFRQVFAFVGEAVVAAGQVLRSPRSANWRQVGPTMEKAGANAVPIVVLINFLIGVVMGFQGAIQLKQFGANELVADLVGLSVCRELGPLMTAIILCGRSGAAFAAELGSMKVSEELDALRTMGFGPMPFLVLPRTVALVLVMPILTLIGDAMGLLGGLVVGLLSLDLSIVQYVNATQDALSVWDVFSGLIKSVVFGVVIALVSCQQGLSTTGGAEGVGKSTTASVVAILFALILVDAAFTLLFWAVSL